MIIYKYLHSNTSLSHTQHQHIRYHSHYLDYNSYFYYHNLSKH